ncbi:uracil-DNA glycosylase family protein [Tenacibaculum agarivorans]|uniref:uracil-DNA glycosylase family protein n=1 Tax=Tenacibaculum agarivorans TaxID=1908389 RepID=UPI00094B8A38|nr:uracil-DNA glycosylase family protein [Tenacibaculum agarivorans]
MQELLSEIKNCTLCEAYIEPRPVVHVNELSKIMIIGQAPGTRVHKTGIPWNDPSGVQLRKWLNVSDDQFYNPDLFGIMPMGFCYPGKGKSGDLPPRKECAPKWHKQVLDHMPKLELTILIGMYAQQYYLGKDAKRTLTETVNHYEDYFPNYFVLPHPSPRNRFWLKKNEWFEKFVVPELQSRVREIIQE